MGIYLTAIGFEIKHKARIGVYISEPRLCNALGIISTVSSQVSITILLIISFYRLVRLTKPYKSLQFKLIVRLLTLTKVTWFIWFVVAAMPLIPLKPLKSAFTFGFVKDRQADRNSVIAFLQSLFLPLKQECCLVLSMYQNRCYKMLFNFQLHQCFKNFQLRRGGLGLGQKIEK